MRQWMSLASIFGLVLYLSEAAAEVYRWTDSEGKVHYSDRKLAQDAEDVTDKVRVQNIDTSQDEQRKLQQIFRTQNDADREYYRQQQEKKKPSPEHRKYCRELHAYLMDIDGPVQFVDESGKPVKVTERERQQKVQKVKQRLHDDCADVE